MAVGYLAELFYLGGNQLVIDIALPRHTSGVGIVKL